MHYLIRLLFFAGITFCTGALFFVMHNNCIDFTVLEQYASAQPSILLDDEGNEWARFQLDRRDPVKFESMPRHLINAFLAAEDRDFFSHCGISLRGIVRSILVNLYHGRKAQGASTITQQLVRFLFFSTQKTFSRKIKEQFFALLIEMQFTKEQIFEAYLNNIYFGCGIYGVQAACQRFWGIDVTTISLDQAATLAAIIRSPLHYSPLLSPLSSLKRRNSVLRSMHSLHLISDAELQEALGKERVLASAKYESFAVHLKESLRIFLEDIFGKEELYHAGLTIQTTLNKKMQLNAEKSFKKNMTSLKKQLADDVDGALMSVDVKTGGIKAMVGGYDFTVSKFNRALQARRQIGSVFKPMVYAAGLMVGRHFYDTEIDEPFVLEQGSVTWTPNNYDMQFHGKMTLARALSQSNNIVTIKMLQAAGIDTVIGLAKKAGIQGPLHPYLSLALGCVDVTVKEAAGFFNVFANNGVYSEPHSIQWVKDRWGKKVWKVNPVTRVVLSNYISGAVAKVLNIGLDRIKRRMPKGWPDVDAISKTGTTNDWRTCWFAGATPTTTTVIYVGRDNNLPIGQDAYPLQTAFPIWLDMHKGLSFPVKHFTFDPSLKEVMINGITGSFVSTLKSAEDITIFI